MNDSYVPPAFAAHSEVEPPDVLYHYTGQTGLLGIVENAELWATKVRYMNDETEFNHALTAADEILDGRIADENTTLARKLACVTLRRSLQGLEDINIFATCFCEDGDLLSQWRGYTAEGGGVAIGFDSRGLKSAATAAGFILGKCIYDAETQRRVVTEAIEHCVAEEIAGRNNWAFHGPLADVIFRIGAFFKDSTFSEEKEWRLVSPVIMFRDERMNFRRGKSMVTPFYKLPILHESSLPIHHAVVGPCPNMELAKSAVTMLLMQHGSHGPLYGRPITFGSKIPFRNW
ncbi:MAG TPA: DUF2971 domain-containing protein [Stellaceae bacterium]|nr:DUF2971 domain-containing protein [Stellaceae bacterium]